jgi:hypothetical protein
MISRLVSRVFGPVFHVCIGVTVNPPENLAVVRQCDNPEIVLAMHALRGLDRRAADERSEIQWQEKALADSWADPSSTRAS